MLKHSLHSKLNEGNISVLGDSWELFQVDMQKVGHIGEH